MDGCIDGLDGYLLSRRGMSLWYLLRWQEAVLSVEHVPSQRGSSTLRRPALPVDPTNTNMQWDSTGISQIHQTIPVFLLERWDDRCRHALVMDLCKHFQTCQPNQLWIESPNQGLELNMINYYYMDYRNYCDYPMDQLLSCSPMDWSSWAYDQLTSISNSRDEGSHPDSLVSSEYPIYIITTITIRIHTLEHTE